MEKVAVFLRKEEAINKFRDVILDSFQESEFTDITICSGFFQERGKYFASDCFNSFTPVLACQRTTKLWESTTEFGKETLILSPRKWGT
ncbi:hypothetical protein ACGT22_22415 [Vibrio parahaemolyticus]|uniref:hypothetical protein n=1 Tax=Vibrio parahaemolyticus TaxID=670 RepID=UPI00193D1F48|nr:hypothetical protein [Vibrio parahaemolyticus]EHK4786421.1 hypothetical protein [Vibrio parahaemolyticus]EIJ0976050.1 hypothetical protein [Vibrio parahaemolyticus]MBM4991891.1 hypothetical protein [Vibrio parahaemolyticus]MBM4996444.1 hypothetical protein [Vibrio parahaemolyticus]MCG6485374.1 hypothetical protein [Vibrio parahaemolyticus]